MEIKLLTRYLFCFILVIQFANCSKDDPFTTPEIPGEEELTEEQQYFMDVAFGNEFGNGYNNVRKWVKPMKIYVPEKTYPHLNEELEKIIEEINTLGERTVIEVVAEQRDANYIAYFGDKQTYVNQYESQASNFVQNNFGLFWIYWSNGFEINRGSMYVDMDRTQGEDCQKHILREEITQSLGLMNDTFDFPKSIFQQNWTCTTTYAEIDKVLIKYLLDDRIQAGMTKRQVIEILKIL